ncbi:unnamed protein product [Leptosia nina]|uniref:Uncharacterized protein n=1 Tax=Leptosia nina TaxID=320188 RepID=A0AAV1JKL7_9NEOP
MVNKNLNLCRVCLYACVTTKSFDKDKDLLLMYEFCCGIIIGDSCPRQVCENCFKELDFYAKFKRKCAESERFWISYNALGDKATNSKNNENLEVHPITKTKYFEEESRNSSIDSLDSVDLLSIEKQIEVLQDSKKKIIKISQLNIDKTKVNSTANILKPHCSVSAKEVPYKKNVVRNNGCGLCKETGFNEKELNTHLSNHLARNTLKCELCDFVGRDFADMLYHRADHVTCVMVSKRGSRLSCFLCKKLRLGSLRLQFHFRQEHLNKEGGWCISCGKTFKTFKGFHAHMKVHNDKELLICNYCNGKFVFKSNLEEHIKSHLGLKTHMCENCGKGFIKQRALRLHLRTAHSTNDRIKCKHCDKMYKNEDTLRHHMREVTRAKPYICTICSKAFSVPSALKSHAFYHTGQRPFQCDTCGAKFKNKSALTAHRLSQHVGVSKHKCVYCEKCFFTSTTLRRHLTVHTGIKKFSCPQCDKGYNDKYRFEAHLAKHS